MVADASFEGWVGLDAESANGKMVWQGYKPKKFEETDVEVEITHCGVCGTDLHTLRSGWMPAPYPIVVGHEIVGKVVNVGSKVTSGIKVGDRVGVGAQSGSCLKGDCEACSHDFEQHCHQMVQTYATNWPNGDQSRGGFAKYWRGSGDFVFYLPDALPSEAAAPMLCGGITVYAPLKQNGCGPGKRVGIAGIGGLGSFGLLFAKALGASKVVAISRTSAKKADALKMGADDFIATGEDEDWSSKHSNSLDLIVSTVDGANMPIQQYLDLLAFQGTLIQVGAPEEGLPAFNGYPVIFKRLTISGSLIGSRQEIREMLQLAADKNVKPWVQQRPMKDANQALVDFEAGLPRYRYVLTA